MRSFFHSISAGALSPPPPIVPDDYTNANGDNLHYNQLGLNNIGLVGGSYINSNPPI